MKTIEAIKEEMSALAEEAAGIEKSLNNDKILEAEEKRLRKRVGAISKRMVFLRICLRYLETQPTRDYLKQEEDRLSRRVELIEKAKNAKFDGVIPTKEQVKAFYTEMNISHAKNHLKNVRFLLAK
jgi:hypothetical protein